MIGWPVAICVKLVKIALLRAEAGQGEGALNPPGVSSQAPRSLPAPGLTANEVIIRTTLSACYEKSAESSCDNGDAVGLDSGDGARAIRARRFRSER